MHHWSSHLFFHFYRHIVYDIAFLACSALYRGSGVDIDILPEISQTRRFVVELVPRIGHSYNKEAEAISLWA